MRLVSLELDNVRTIVHAEIPLHNGVSIFTGDIGTGKSSAVKGLEAALLGGERNQLGELLRWGTEKGRVRVAFERKYPCVLTRTLLRDASGHVRQGDIECKITKHGSVTRKVWSPTEAHARLFTKLLRFPVPYARRHDVFRHIFAVPQDAMRDVLDDGAKDRVAVMRRVFRVEQFNIAAENSG